MTAPMPTAPGWWWRGKAGGDPSALTAAWVFEDPDGMWAWGPETEASPVGDWRGWWLAPIPSPAVCEALARYAEALVSPAADYYSLADLVDALADALRAERDGAA